MDILVIGIGVIGTTYGYLFKKSGHTVEHYVRQSRSRFNLKELNIEMLDGRTDSKGASVTDTYTINHCTKKCYDYIFISVPSGGIENVIDTLDKENITGTIILCCGIWKDNSYLIELMKDKKYILGYPVAGGNIKNGTLNCCVFNNFMLEKESNTNIDNYNNLISLFTDCKIKAEQPFNMLEWIWLHMAINAGVVSVAGYYGDIHNTSQSAEKLMDSREMLAQVIKSIRETTKIIKSRNVVLKNYNNEIFAYKLPVCLSSRVMKKIFKSNILTRKIMTLHDSTDDLVYVCRCLYNCGKSNNVAAPLFYKFCEETLNKATK